MEEEVKGEKFGSMGGRERREENGGGGGEMMRNDCVGEPEPFYEEPGQLQFTRHHLEGGHECKINKSNRIIDFAST